VGNKLFGKMLYYNLNLRIKVWIQNEENLKDSTFPLM
jgi:hypothetical protein